jgi:hypothetical protein
VGQFTKQKKSYVTEIAAGETSGARPILAVSSCVEIFYIFNLTHGYSAGACFRPVSRRVTGGFCESCCCCIAENSVGKTYSYPLMPHLSSLQVISIIILDPLAKPLYRLLNVRLYEFNTSK